MSYYRSSVARDLSERQIEVVKLVSHRLYNKEIAKELGINTKTVRDHVSKALEILGLESRMQIAIWVLKKGIVKLEEINLPGEAI